MKYILIPDLLFTPKLGVIAHNESVEMRSFMAYPKGNDPYVYIAFFNDILFAVSDSEEGAWKEGNTSLSLCNVELQPVPLFVMRRRKTTLGKVHDP